jgi:hypothetical protein
VETVAMPVFDDCHVALALIFRVVPSEKVAIAVNWSVPFTVRLGFNAVTVMDCKDELLTFAVVEPVSDPEVAVIVVEPVATAVAKPLELMVATDGVEDVQVAFKVPPLLPSLLTPVAVNCWVMPTTRLGFLGVTRIEVIVGVVKNAWQAASESSPRTRAANPAVHTYPLAHT